MKLLTRKDKEKKVAELKEEFENAKLVILTQFSGLNVQQIQEIKQKLKQKNIKFKVVKNRLVKLATKDIVPELGNFLREPTAIAVDKESETTAAYELYEFEKKKIGIKIKAGVLKGKVIEYEDIKTLATAPKKEVIISQLLQLLNIQLYNLMMLLTTPLTQLTFLLDKISEKKEGG